ncbi:hypothetical protein ATR1_039c0085 [Acetobacter tropicalis]|uniref:Uncharacterized protein n=1 Tax=Acetobacter tropicalis TaxID=104102 RepID=A0A511FNI8_9PROT|nr:hypothetical protein ATR1_039c0085 [Acetobacter tropicalis]GEL50521.1 hypothetical protein ATR01nite_15960 [Acetobacter tropicalis]
MASGAPKPDTQKARQPGKTSVNTGKLRHTSHNRKKRGLPERNLPQWCPIKPGGPASRRHMHPYRGHTSPLCTVKDPTDTGKKR